MKKLFLLAIVLVCNLYAVVQVTSAPKGTTASGTCFECWRSRDLFVTIKSRPAKSFFYRSEAFSTV